MSASSKISPRYFKHGLLKMSTSVKEMSKNNESETQELIYQRDLQIIKPALNLINKMQEETVKQAMDAHSIFLTESSREMMTPEKFASYPHSPTANRYQKAFDMFLSAYYCLMNYTKQTVENKEDCEYLQSAFHEYARAEMIEQHLFSYFRPPDDTCQLIDQYLEIRPDDILVRYFKVVIVLNPDPLKYKSENPSDFALQKKMIIAAEKFIHKRLREGIASEIDRSMVGSLYYRLGSIYVTTNQNKRALDSFQKCLDLDKTDLSALYGVAYQYMEREPDKAIKLFTEFIDKAPECDKQYPNALYMVAFVYCTHYENIQEALRYCQLAEEAEQNRLSFLYPVDIPQKKAMQMLKSMHKNLRK